MKKLAIAGASVVLAALPVVGVFAQDTSVTDTIQITVSDACTITEGSTTAGLDNNDTTYADTVANGAETTFSTTHGGNHVFHVSCNAPNGWKLTVNPTDLAGHISSTNTATNNDVISFVAPTSYDNTSTAGQWTATISVPQASGVSVTQPSATGNNIVISETGGQAANLEITSTYKAYVGTETAAGYYEGTIGYTLATL